jgi:hypothetical protein
MTSLLIQRPNYEWTNDRANFLASRSNNLLYSAVDDNCRAWSDAIDEWFANRIHSSSTRVSLWGQTYQDRVSLDRERCGAGDCAEIVPAYIRSCWLTLRVRRPQKERLPRRGMGLILPARKWLLCMFGFIALSWGATTTWFRKKFEISGRRDAIKTPLRDFTNLAVEWWKGTPIAVRKIGNNIFSTRGWGTSAFFSPQIMHNSLVTLRSTCNTGRINFSSEEFLG